MVRSSSVAHGSADTEGDRTAKWNRVSGPCQRMAASMTASVQHGPQKVSGVGGHPTCKFSVTSLSGQTANTPWLLSRTKAGLSEDCTRQLMTPANSKIRKGCIEYRFSF